MLSSFSCSVLKRPRCKNELIFHFHVNSLMNSQLIIHHQKLLNSKNLHLVHEHVEKRSSAPEKCKTQFGRKINSICLVCCCWQRTCTFTLKTTKSKIPFPIHSSCITCIEWIAHPYKNDVLHKLHLKQHAHHVQSPKTSKHSSTVDIIPPFCSKFRAVHKETISSTKRLHKRKRSTCSP